MAAAKAPEADTTTESVSDPTPVTEPNEDDYDLVYVCNPDIHKDVKPAPSPGRVTRLWLRMHADKGWVECDANGEPVKGS